MSISDMMLLSPFSDATSAGLKPPKPRPASLAPLRRGFFCRTAWVLCWRCCFSKGNEPMTQRPARVMIKLNRAVHNFCLDEFVSRHNGSGDAVSAIFAKKSVLSASVVPQHNRRRRRDP
jgi:hypothetical protein